MTEVSYDNGLALHRQMIIDLNSRIEIVSDGLDYFPLDEGLAPEESILSTLYAADVKTEAQTDLDRLLKGLRPIQIYELFFYLRYENNSMWKKVYENSESLSIDPEQGMRFHLGSIYNLLIDQLIDNRVALIMNLIKMAEGSTVKGDSIG